MSNTGASPLPAFENLPCSGVTLDRLVQPALLVLLAKGPLHGYRLAEALAELPPFRGERPDPSGVYRLLRLLEGRDLVAARWDVSERGPARRLYELTDAGRACLGRWVETLDGYQKAVAELVAIAREVASAPS